MSEKLKIKLCLKTITLVFCSIMLCVGIIGPSNVSFAAEPIKIGHLNDITGCLATYALGHKRAAEAAIKRINQMGGIAGRPVEYVPEDTASDAKTAVEKMRRLVFKKNVDFILGSDVSSCCVATNPLAEKLNVVTFQQGDSDGITVKGNRWVFQTLMPATGEMKHLVEQVWANTKARKWASVLWDYTWGHSCADGFKRFLEEKGGTFLGKIPVPLEETDMSRYVPKIPAEAEGVALFLYGAGGFNVMKELAKRRPDLERCGRCTFEAVNVKSLGNFANGVRVYKSMLRVADDVPTHMKEYDQAYRKALGIDEFGVDAKTGKEIVYELSYSDWEAIYFIKEAIEATGWKNKEDNLKLIKYLEGAKAELGYEHPQGPKWIRPEDHVFFQPSYMCITRDNMIRLEKIIGLEEGIFTPPLNNYIK